MEYVVNTDDIREVLGEMGGKASVAEIRRKLLEIFTGGEVPSNYSSFITFRATVQRKIENHCPEADDYDGSKSAYFRRVGYGEYELMNKDKTITYTPVGKSTPQTPHRFPKYDNKFVVSESKFDDDYILVDSLDELSAFIEAGYSVRMSTGDSNAPPSLIVSKSLKVDGGKSPEKSLRDELKRLAEEELDSTITTTSRKEQILLRGHLLDKKDSAPCHICGEVFPADLLVAAHLKSRSKCQPKEKLDFDNVAKLMCKFGCDDLYEKGYIFVQEGEVRRNPKRTSTRHMRTYISLLEGRKIEGWLESEKYYNWHHKKVTS